MQDMQHMRCNGQDMGLEGSQACMPQQARDHRNGPWTVGAAEGTSVGAATEELDLATAQGVAEDTNKKLRTRRDRRACEHARESFSLAQEGPIDRAIGSFLIPTGCINS